MKRKEMSDEMLFMVREQQEALRAKYFNELKVGDKVLYTGWSSYSFWVDVDMIGNKQYKVPGTIIAINAHNIVIELDNSRKPYFVKNNDKKTETNLWVIPSKNIAVVTFADLLIQSKEIESCY